MAPGVLTAEGGAAVGSTLEHDLEEERRRFKIIVHSRAFPDVASYRALCTVLQHLFLMWFGMPSEMNRGFRRAQLGKSRCVNVGSLPFVASSNMHRLQMPAAPRARGTGERHPPSRRPASVRPPESGDSSASPLGARAGQPAAMQSGVIGVCVLSCVVTCIFFFV